MGSSIKGSKNRIFDGVLELPWEFGGIGGGPGEHLDQAFEESAAGENTAA